ncbi:MAG: SprT family zinc-dependent metalloprotease [Pseudomonadota bacterium]|nr:SprT family zinc-dependent metalloprotease [Pseudomonadota bacterium]
MTKSPDTRYFGNFEGAPITVCWTTRKKSIALSVRDGAIVILSPMHVSDGEIDALIATNADWVRGKLAKQAKTKKRTEHRYIDGEQFFYLGEEYPLKVVDGRKPLAELVEGSFVVHARRSQTPERRARSIRAAFLRWYKSEAETVLTQRVAFFSPRIGRTPKRIFFRDYKSMWGNCDVDGRITFNWKLVMAPEHILDYVVVHEMVHLHHLNHSPAFWQRVEALLPDYKQRRKWLKDHGGLLAV